MKKTIVQNPFKNLKLDPEERELLRSFEAGEWKPVKNFPAEKKRLQTIARATLVKMRNINIRLTEADLYGLKVKAIEEGIPYQTLAASILHKYVASA